MSLKERARAYHTAVSNHDAATIEQMVHADYIQHNPFVPTGRDAFVALLPKLKEHGSKIRNIRILEDGQHVIMHHQWENAAPFGHDRMVAFHILRFDADGLIAEHWNVMTKDIADSLGASLTDGATRIEERTRTNENKARVLEWFAQDLFGTSELEYRKQHKVFGEGNFVLSISEGIRSGVPSAIYDLFRLKNGDRAEHWRIAQEIPSENLANDNTMFGF